MIPKISICIICNEDDVKPQKNLAELRKFSDEIIIVNSHLDGNRATVRQNKKSFLSVINDSDSTMALTKAINLASGEWILILKANEIISKQTCQHIRKLCQKNSVHAYQFVCRVSLKRDELSRYEWLGNFGKFSSPEVAQNSYIPSVEVRFFKKSVFNNVLAFDDEVVQINVKKNARIEMYGPIQSFSQREDFDSHFGLSDDEKWHKDNQRFFIGDDAVSEQTSSFELIGPGNIGYSLISEYDLPSLEAGLEMGFGRIDMLKWAVHNLNKIGAYDKAIQFADKVLQKMPDCFEIWHLKGIACFYKLDFANAEKYIRKALNLNAEDKNTLSDLLRVYIVSGKFAQAESVLDKIKGLHGLSEENKYIYDSIKQNKGRQSKVSLLIICRNEENYISRNLSSVKDIVDEIVAVDTGSTDKTIDILKEYGAKIVHHIWKDDFAEARNSGLSQVTGDYVFQLDADEYIDVETRIAFWVLKNLLPLKDKKGFVFDIHTLDGSFEVATIDKAGIQPTEITRRTSLFPNVSNVRFTGKVLETVDSSLESLNIPLVLAESIPIRHHNRDHASRCLRKVQAMDKSFEDFGPKRLFQGVQFWLDMENHHQAIKWFEHALSKTNRDSCYLDTICKLFDSFKLNQQIEFHPQIFTELLKQYGVSYRITSLCADYLYELKEYDGAIKLLKRLVAGKGDQFVDKPALPDIQRNRLNLAMASLEQDDLETCDKMVALMSDDIEMVDAARAVIFYMEIRKKELENAVVVLDHWIKERSIPITDTINNFGEFLKLIIRLSDILISFGYFAAGNVLIRSADYFASTLTAQSR